MNAVLALSLSLLCSQDVAWKSSWAEALKEVKGTKKLAVLVFFNKGLKNCKRFESETLSDGAVKGALKKHVCALVDPDGTDDDNRLWQKHGSPDLPMTYVYDPDGTLLTSVSALKASIYAEALEAAGPAYFDKVAPAREALAKDPHQPDKLVLLAEAYAAMNNGKESAGCYDRAVEALVKKGDKAGALKVLEDQLRKYYDFKWYVEARGCCRKLVELDPSNGTKLRPMAAWVLGMADCKESKWADAIACLKSACEQYKDADIMDKMMFSLGSAYMYNREKDKAIATFDEIVMKFCFSDTASLAKTQADKLRNQK